jgi:hypothetical protein
MVPFALFRGGGWLAGMAATVEEKVGDVNEKERKGR